MDISRSREKLNAFLGYVLGRNPYEFGLVPTKDGFIKIKELLKAIKEEEGFRHVTAHSLDELLVTVKDPLIEIHEDQIRAKDRDKLPQTSFEETVPKLLYIGIRTRAHGHVMQKGIAPYEDQDYVILSSDKDLAERIGKRKDPQPVIITVHTGQAEEMGVLFIFAGENIYLARNIPPGCFSAPPLAAPDEDRSRLRKTRPAEKRIAPTPGSFFLDIGEMPANGKHKQGRQDKLSWKHNKKKIRKDKEKFRGDN